MHVCKPDPTIQHNPHLKGQNGITCEVSLCRPPMDTVVHFLQHPDGVMVSGLHYSLGRK
jgi:hypothetical protein